MMVLKQKQFSKEKAKEAGLIAGSAGIGVGSGLLVRKLAEDTPRILDNIAVKAVKDKNGKFTGKYVSKEPGYKIATKLGPGARKLSKFAKTKSGKVVLIGVPTAAIGGVTYLEAKKKDKNNKK